MDPELAVVLAKVDAASAEVTAMVARVTAGDADSVDLYNACESARISVSAALRDHRPRDSGARERILLDRRWNAALFGEGSDSADIDTEPPGLSIGQAEAFVSMLDETKTHSLQAVGRHRAGSSEVGFGGWVAIGLVAFFLFSVAKDCRGVSSGSGDRREPAVAAFAAETPAAVP